MVVVTRSTYEALGVDGYSESSAAPSACDEHPDATQELLACEASFSHFLKHWRYVDRETGEVRTFTALWEGQADAVAMMEAYPRLFLLKAGKLGFTELECAFDGWVLRFRGRNARVHTFSIDAEEAKALLVIVRFGMDHLPGYMRLTMATGAGSDTSRQTKYYAGPDDFRLLHAYASTTSAAIAQTASHSHVDELARMRWPEVTWASIESTVPAEGTAHIVSRGAGDTNYTAELWEETQADGSVLKGHFSDYMKRPRTPLPATPADVPRIAKMNAEDRARLWYSQQTMPLDELHYFAPRDAAEALAGKSEEAFVRMEHWDACGPDGGDRRRMPSLLPGDRIPIVLSLDAGVTNDLFAAAAISRHPGYVDDAGNFIEGSERPDDPAVRAVQVWEPEPGTGEIDFLKVENWIRHVCLGGCVAGHPNGSGGQPSKPPEGETCGPCEKGERVPSHNVVQICYDPFQLHDMMQRFRREQFVWCNAFDQGGDRLKADSDLRKLIIQRRLAHNGNLLLRQHVRNASAKVQLGEDSKLRIVKRTPKAKVDAIVAVSMGTERCLYLDMSSAA